MNSAYSVVSLLRNNIYKYIYIYIYIYIFKMIHFKTSSIVQSTFQNTKEFNSSGTCVTLIHGGK